MNWKYISSCSKNLWIVFSFIAYLNLLEVESQEIPVLVNVAKNLVRFWDARETSTTEEFGKY